MSGSIASSTPQKAKPITLEMRRLPPMMSISPEADSERPFVKMPSTPISVKPAANIALKMMV